MIEPDKEMNRVDERIALVTGAAGGIGSETCRLLAKAGAVVVASDRRVSEVQAGANGPRAATVPTSRTLSATVGVCASRPGAAARPSAATSTSVVILIGAS